MKYRIVFDQRLNLDFFEKKVAYDRMARYGKLEAGKAKDDWWWTPSPSQKPRERIEREGYVILEEKA